MGDLTLQHKDTGMNEALFCLIESRHCMDLLDGETKWLKKCDLLRADSSDSYSLVYFLKSSVLSSPGLFSSARPLHCIPQFLSDVVTELAV